MSGPGGSGLSDLSLAGLPLHPLYQGDLSHLNRPSDNKTYAYEKASNARELELKIIRQTLKRSKAEQIEEINKSYKWEVDALRQELTAEADGKIASEVC